MSLTLVPQTRPPSNRNLMLELTVTTAIVSSIAMSGFGVASAFWGQLTAGNPAAFAATAMIGGVLLASEVGAVVIARAIVADGLSWARGALFGASLAANVVSGHYGAEAINGRLIASQRAPYEAAASSSAALLEAAQNGLDALDGRHAQERAELERVNEAERAANPGFITARGRQAEAARTSLATRQQAERQALATELAAAETQNATDAAALVEAPTGFGETQKWGFAALLELFKSLLVLAIAPRRRRFTGNVMALPVDRSAYEEMNEAECEDILTRGRTASGLAQWRLNRLRGKVARRA